MKAAIISDIHDNLINLEKCLNWCKKKKIKNLICCGDVTNSETINFLAEKFVGQIYLVRGNIEIYNEEGIKNYKNIKYLGRIGRIKLGGKKIGICHEPYLIDKIIKRRKLTSGHPKTSFRGFCDIIFYGHTHKPWEEYKEGIRIINSGTLGGVFQKATFAVLDTETAQVELKILELL